MNHSVAARARAIATFRHVSVWLMETTARWTPLTAEMEAKVLLGRHIWDFAQMADALGKRTFELRQPEHWTLPPSPGYAALLADIAAIRGAPACVATLYDGFLPGWAARCREYVAGTDPILDEPSTVILERIVRDLERQCREATALQRELGWPAGADAIAARERGLALLAAEAVAA